MNRSLRLDKVKRGTDQRPVEMPEALLHWIAPFRQKSGFVFAPPGFGQDRNANGGMDTRQRQVSAEATARAVEDAFAWRLRESNTNGIGTRLG